MKLDTHQWWALPLGHSLLALLFTACVTIPLSRSAPTQSTQAPGISLFHTGDDALSWDSDELIRVRSLHAPDVSDTKVFFASSSVANYLRLQPVEALHMPVPVNIIFVGFQADGNMHVNISTQQLQDWFGHLDHVLPHTRVELSELTCQEDGHCAGLVHGTVRAQPVASYVHLNFSCNVIVTRKGSLAQTFERALHVFSRPTDPEIEMGAQQVDAAKMEGFIDGFLSHLGILEVGYTLLVLNPTWSVSEPVYGYRQGLSQAEMDVLLANPNRVHDLLQASYALNEPIIPIGPQSNNNWAARLSRSVQSKFAVVDHSWSGDAWVQTMDKYLTEMEDYRKAMLKAAGTGRGSAAVAHAVTLMRRRESPMSQILHEELLYPDPFQTIYSKFRTMHPAEDCLVGNWVGHQRWAMVDLTAGGADWGPALGGEGVVHRHSLPSVMDHFSNLQDLRTRHLVNGADQSEKLLLADLAQQTHAHKSQRTTTAYQAFSAEMASARRPQSPDEPPSPPLDNKEEREMQARKWKVKYQETLLKAELEMTEMFAARHCSNLQTSPKICMHMKEQATNARNMLAKLAGSQALSVDVWRDLQWDVFGQDHNLELESAEIATEAQRSRDLFLGELNGVLSRALRHVVAPPTATWTHAAGYLHDTATPFAKHVAFHVYIIRESVRTGAEHINAPQSFSLSQYTQEVLRLALPGQKFDFERHEINLQDDMVMATAFAAAQRASAQEIPSETDSVQEAERIWVDTRVLAHMLRQRFANARSPVHPPPGMSAYRQQVLNDWLSSKKQYRQAAESTEGAANHESYAVPVFVFELHREYAVLLDEHYNAKALEDMILVVQNSARDDEHPTGMMCGGALLARPLSPLREALSATLTHLSGVLPPHLGYSPGRKKVQHDWLWSVGSHPHSFTSLGTHYSELQRDALARSYLLDAVDSSVELVNEGIASLRAVTPNQAVHNHLKANKVKLAEMLALWPEILGQWRSVMESAWHLNWGVATMQLASLEDRSLRFMHLAQRLSTIPLGGQCIGVIKASWSETLVTPTLIMSCVVAAWALAYLAWPALVTSKSAKTRGYGGNSLRL